MLEKMKEEIWLWNNLDIGNLSARHERWRTDIKNNLRKSVQRVWSGSRSYIIVLWTAVQYGPFEIYGRFEASFASIFRVVIVVRTSYLARLRVI